MKENKCNILKLIVGYIVFLTSVNFRYNLGNNTSSSNPYFRTNIIAIAKTYFISLYKLPIIRKIYVKFMVDKKSS